MTALDNVIAKLKPLNPLFTDFTWGAGGSTSDLTVELCQKSIDKFNLNPNMHLTCTNMEMDKIKVALEKCTETGMTNVLALRGDPPLGQEKWTATEGGFTCALDLVRYIRSEYGDKFSVSVAGYPEGHPNSMTQVHGSIDELSDNERLRVNTENTDSGETVVHVCRDADYKTEIDYLKAKIDAGADFIVTQMIFDAEVYGHFVSVCRAAGITVPILPGLMCVTTYGGFKRMTKFCKSRVPESIWARFEAVRDDEAAVKHLGIQIGFEICKRLLELGAPGIHFYTLNLGNTTIGITNKLVEDGVLPARVGAEEATA